MPDLFLYSYLIYLVLLLFALMATVWWRRRLRRAKLPFDTRFERVSRLPGEGARSKIEKFTDDLINDAFASFFAPWALIVTTAVVIRYAKPTGTVLIGTVLALPLVTFILLVLFVVRMSRRIMERSDWHLGQYGERNVADNLEPLRQRGWRVFHDVPAQRKGVKFNIDHVVVGPGGVIAVETKTPRRPEMANSSSENHVVDYDGEKLRWPTGKIDYDKPRKAKARADWLKDWLKEQDVPVRDVFAVLAIPWWLVRIPPGSNFDTPAVNPGQLVGLILSLPGILSRDHINAISAKLEAHCRNVEF